MVIHVRVLPEEEMISLTLPNKTTYVVGESISYTGGSVYNEATGKSVALSSSNVNGFDSKTVGIKTLTVTSGQYKKEFKILVVDKLDIAMDFGSKYSDIQFPTNSYGVYKMNGNLNTIFGTVGKHSLKATFTPNDYEGQKLSSHVAVPVTVNVTRDIGSAGMVVNYDRNLNTVTYMGTVIEPTLTLSADGKVLRARQDYIVTYRDNMHNNRTVASGGIITIKGAGFHKGEIIKQFDIHKARLSIKANWCESKMSRRLDVVKTLIEVQELIK